MVAFRLDQFAGLIPRLGDKLLPNGYATECLNAKLFSGELRGWPALDIGNPLHDFADAQTYAFVAKLRNNAGTEIFFGAAEERTSIVPDPVIDEAYDRFYIFEPDEPVQVATFSQLQLGQTPDDLALPLPTTAPTVAATSGAPDGSTPSEDRVYVFTWQTEWGEETEPSPTATVQVAADDSVDLSSIEQPPAIAGRSWERINIYRSVAGTTAVQFYFVASITPPTAAYTDTTKSAYVVYNAVLDAFSNEAPPDGLQGARVHPSGALVAFLGRKVYFSRPYLPHAWPAVYALSVDDDIIGLEIYGTNIVVVTSTFIYFLYGQLPGAFGLQKFPFPSPGVSYRSLAPAAAGVYYASTDGLVFVNDSGPQLVTAGLIDPDSWAADFFDGDLVAAVYKNIYVAWNRSTAGFMVDLRYEKPSITQWETGSGYSVTGMALDEYTGDLFLAIDDEVYLWDDPTTAAREYTWRSGVLVTPKPVNLGALHIRGAAGGSADVDLIADGVTKFSETVAFNQARKLPSGYKATDWSVRVTSSHNIHAIHMAETGAELASV